MLAWGPLWHDLVRLTRARRQRNWPYDAEWPHFVASTAAGPVSLIRLPTGAPAAVLLLEYVIACGGRTIVGIGLGGGLDPALSIGSVVVVSSALPGEGTSAYYREELQSMAATAGPFSPVPASIWLVARLSHAFDRAGVPAIEGRAWTTDAPYRETPQLISARRREGAVVVDMETSAMYQVGCFRGAALCNVLLVSDQVWPVWRPGFHTAELRIVREQVSSALVQIGEQLLALPGCSPLP